MRPAPSSSIWGRRQRLRDFYRFRCNRSSLSAKLEELVTPRGRLLY
jgi:hypothetical protein